MSLPSQANVFIWILKAFVVLVFLQCAVPVEGQCLRRRRVPVLDFPTDVPMWEIYGMNPYAPVIVEPIPFTPLQISNYAAVRAVNAVEISGDERKGNDDAAVIEEPTSETEVESLKQKLDEVKSLADRNLKRAERAESKIGKLEADSSRVSSQGQSLPAGKGASKGRRSAKRGTAALKQELARLEKLTKQQVTRATQKIERDYKKKIDMVIKTGKSVSSPAVKSLMLERDETKEKTVKKIREMSKKRLSEIQNELAARARS